MRGSRLHLIKALQIEEHEGLVHLSNAAADLLAHNPTLQWLQRAPPAALPDAALSPFGGLAEAWEAVTLRTFNKGI